MRQQRLARERQIFNEQLALRMPVLQVEFLFDGLSDGQRFGFMRRFDLYMQRGGG